VVEISVGYRALANAAFPHELPCFLDPFHIIEILSQSSYVEGKDKNQILNETYGTAKSGSVVHEQQKAVILVRCTEDFEEAIKSLNEKISVLDVVLAAATVVGLMRSYVL